MIIILNIILMVKFTSHNALTLSSISIVIIIIIIISIIVIIIITTVIIIIITMFTSHNALTQSGCCPTTPGSQQSHTEEGAGPGPG